MALVDDPAAQSAAMNQGLQEALAARNAAGLGPPPATLTQTGSNVVLGGKIAAGSPFGGGAATSAPPADPNNLSLIDARTGQAPDPATTRTDANGNVFDKATGKIVPLVISGYQTLVSDPIPGMPDEQHGGLAPGTYHVNPDGSILILTAQPAGRAGVRPGDTVTQNGRVLGLDGQPRVNHQLDQNGNVVPGGTTQDVWAVRQPDGKPATANPNFSGEGVLTNDSGTGLVDEVVGGIPGLKEVLGFAGSAIGGADLTGLNKASGDAQALEQQFLAQLNGLKPGTAPTMNAAQSQASAMQAAQMGATSMDAVGAQAAQMQGAPAMQAAQARAEAAQAATAGATPGINAAAMTPAQAAQVAMMSASGMSPSQIQASLAEAAQMAPTANIAASQMSPAEQIRASQIEASKMQAANDIGAAQMQGVGPVEAAQMTAAQLDDARQAQFRAQQAGLATSLSDVIAGKTPSVAELQMRQAFGQQMAQQQGLAAALGRGGNQALAMRTAMNNMGQLGAQQAAASALLRAQEQAAARGQLGGVLEAARGTDVNVAAQNAQNLQGAGQVNVTAQNAMSQFNAQNQQSTGALNAQLEQQARIQNQQTQQAAAAQTSAQTQAAAAFNAQNEQAAATLYAQQVQAANAQNTAQAQAAAVQNQQIQQQTAAINAANKQAALSQTSAQQQAAAATNAANTQAASQFNAGAQNAASATNAGAQNAANQQLAANEQAANAQNAQLQQQAATQNAANTQAVNLANAANQQSALSQTSQQAQQTALANAANQQQASATNVGNTQAQNLANAQLQQAALLQTSAQAQAAASQNAQQAQAAAALNAQNQQAAGALNTTATNQMALANAANQQQANAANQTSALTTTGQDITRQQVVGNQTLQANQNDVAAQVGAIQAQNQQTQQTMNLLSTGLGALATLSDRRAKEDIHDVSPDDARAFYQAIRPQSWNYKGGTAKHVGPMAQDLEKSKIGKTMIRETPAGKAISMPDATTALLAMVAHMGRRLDQLEGGRT